MLQLSRNRLRIITMLVTVMKIVPICLFESIRPMMKLFEVLKQTHKTNCQRPRSVYVLLKV
jgi:hypothetical protein